MARGFADSNMMTNTSQSLEGALSGKILYKKEFMKGEYLWVLDQVVTAEEHAELAKKYNPNEGYNDQYYHMLRRLVMDKIGMSHKEGTTPAVAVFKKSSMYIRVPKRKNKGKAAGSSKLLYKDKGVDLSSVYMVYDKYIEPSASMPIVETVLFLTEDYIRFHFVEGD